MSDTSRQLAEHLRFFAELGVAGVSTDSRWSKRPDLPSQEHRTSDIEHPISDSGAPLRVFGSSSEALAAIRADIGEACDRCKLHTLGRRQVVFGVGNPDADLMFVGEAPGADEDIQGIPFV